VKRRDKARRPLKASKRIGVKALNRDDTLEQLTATSEVLEAISRSTFDLQTVLATLVKSAGRLCQAENVQIFLYDGEFYRLAADNGFSPEYEQYARDHPIKPGRDTLVARTALAIEAVQIPDALADPEYTHGGQKLGGYRTLLGVPLLRDKSCIGVIALTRSKVQPFTDRQIALVTNFAAQAVIAIENTRLLNELRESLQQQTATADVLKVISSSPGELTPVFQAMLEQATRICDAKFGIVFRYDGGLFHPVASLDLPPALATFMAKQGAFAPKPGQLFGQLCESKSVISVIDRANDSEPSPSFRYGGARSSIAVPMMKDDELVGALFIYRTEVRPFTDKQIQLVKNFAAQAVIAIENTRLLNELRESLQQQTATSDVLKVISSSISELRPVFEIIGQRAERLCDAEISLISMVDGDLIQLVSINGVTKEGVEAVRNAFYPMRRNDETIAARTVRSGTVCHVADVLNDPLYPRKDAARAGGFRGALGVPMIREGEVIGAIFVARKQPGLFTDNQVQLLKTFADQAVIAIENVRLFESVEARTRELAKSLEELRTTQDRLVQTQKLASLGQLTAGIAHEIKNPLNFVNNFSGVSAELIDELQEALKDSSLNNKRREEVAELMGTLRSNLDKVVQHGKRADAIVKNMLLHSHQGSGEHRPVAINAIVEESLKLAYHGARAEKDNFNVMVEQSFDPVAGEADIFPQEITRVLLNLISNAVYATKKKTTGDGEIYKPTLTVSTQSLGDRVEIRIRDNGMGVPPEVKDKMFNPFFTTKPAGEGTGLGLSISHDIVVKQHGGSIEIDTEQGKFTEVRVILPRVAVFI
jgi:two-component system, NtrC family, sensor kinase